MAVVIKLGSVPGVRPQALLALSCLTFLRAPLETEAWRG